MSRQDGVLRSIKAHLCVVALSMPLRHRAGLRPWSGQVAYHLARASCRITPQVLPIYMGAVLVHFDLSQHVVQRRGRTGQI